MKQRGDCQTCLSVATLSLNLDFTPAKISSFQVKYKALKLMSLGMTLHGPLSFLLPYCGPS